MTKPNSPLTLDALFTLRETGESITILDQTQLPQSHVTRCLATLDDVIEAISTMQVRGAPLIGVTAAYGVALAMQKDAADDALTNACSALAASRPTAVNLHWALARMNTHLAPLPAAERCAAAWAEARAIAEEDATTNQQIGGHGLGLLRNIKPRRPDQVLNILTHCNAGWLATTAHGTALAPIYAAQKAGIAVHVYVSETRPRNQGLLTAWELREAGLPHTLIADNAAGHLIQQGKIDLVIVGADRIAANGDTANKIGTYLKALAAKENQIPFYVAAPISTIDFQCADGSRIPIEERAADEVTHISGLNELGQPQKISIVPATTPVFNPAFDVTPAKLITGIITERGIFAPRDLATLRLKTPVIPATAGIQRL